LLNRFAARLSRIPSSCPSEPSSSTSLMQNEDRTDTGPFAERARVTAVL
jgi:hypothetical protein